jgi:integrase
MGLGAGLRQSEATDLSVDRIDFLRRELTVDRQLVTPEAGEPTFGPPKSARSYRTVPLADTVVQALAHHVQVHGLGRDDLVLHGTDGRPLRRQRFGDVKPGPAPA